MSPGLEPMLGAVGTMGGCRGALQAWRGCVGSVQPKGIPGFRGGSGGRAGSVLPCECFRLDPDHPPAPVSHLVTPAPQILTDFRELGVGSLYEVLESPQAIPSHESMLGPCLYEGSRT